ncbi:MAG: tyrosyl-tRNA synthetase, tyrosyl-tRNA synthetase [Candidatus Peregrinibacteria bacterium GW2011_GWF2_38_29]|nr:MAG: tyrosyl-tRNA synthetase, tyrosyl-tRNA synthetase [Candidatus Peregrinibacteria bacterium GW2011_GWF2_38_29]HBB02985.1 tyrosine--tRNA ligase [Candidatus Peregrinibacteria bacterium]
MDKSILSEVLNRGVADVIVRAELEEALKSGKTLNVKLGIDPSGADLHIGHMVVIKKLKQLQDLGHKIFLLFGNFTGQIGDPTDKLEARKVKTKEELEENARTYVKQAGKILDPKKVEIVWNADWLEKLTFKKVIKLSQIFTVSQMLERDMYQERIKKNAPIYMHEFFYPLMQGYDSVALKSDIELGGTDQTFNLLAGREMQRSLGQKPQSIITVPILEGTDGKLKMGKTTGNYIGINEPPKDMFGKTMSISDNLIIKYFELTTNVPLKEIKKMEKAMAEGENPRNLKVKLAHELVSFYHSKELADQAEQEFANIFSKNALPDEIEEKKFPKGEYKLIDLLAMSELLSSKGEARRMIQGGGVKINDEKVSDENMTIKLDKEYLLQVGKRKFLKIKP